jgi:cysteinyl-tRNA synthetase
MAASRASEGHVRLYDTMSGTKRTFVTEGDVRLYVCGVTPYDTTHVGHARTYLVFDVLVRHLIHHGLRVNYVQNITDVDDSILKRAAELEEPYDELGDRYTAVYMEDLADLGMIPAGAYPRATQAIPEIQQVIARLLETGHAYRVDGDVFFRVARVETYGELSRLERAEMLAIEAEQDAHTIDDVRKDDPLDFLLWRRAHGSGPSWPSPWGAGRPGWHVECSTLALRHLGAQVDIHGGGADLVFPHHEAEIVQSEAFTNVRPFARFWVHVAMARLGGEKMAKSKANMVFVRDLLARYPADAVRLYVLGTHYREPLDFDEEEVRAATGLAARLSRAARVPVPRASGSQGRAFTVRFVERLDDDLDTPGAIAVLRELGDLVLDRRDATLESRRTLRTLAARLGLSLEAGR